MKTFRKISRLSDVFRKIGKSRRNGRILGRGANISATGAGRRRASADRAKSPGFLRILGPGASWSELWEILRNRGQMSTLSAKSQDIPTKSRSVGAIDQVPPVFTPTLRDLVELILRVSAS